MVKCDNLKVTLGNRTILDEVSFELKEGEIVGLLGQNGAGKTTLLRTMCGLIRSDSGDTEVDGFSIKNDRENYLSLIGALIEGPAAYPNLNAYENITLYTNLYGRPDKKRIENILTEFGIADRKKKVKDFSLGMKQKLGIAMATYNDSSLIMLDEPLNGCDPIAIVKIKKYLRHLADEQKKTILISSHLLSELETFCDRLLIMDGGKIVKEIKNNYANQETSELEREYLEAVVGIGSKELL